MLHTSLPKPNRFITIEGGEGVGKTSLIQGLKTRIEAEAGKVILTREPGGTPLGDKIRELFLHPPETPSALSELFLISAARVQHVQTLIKPALEAGHWILCDRFYDSTRVYQGDLGKAPLETLEGILEHSVQGCHPGLTFVVDCPADVARNRVVARAKNLPSSERNRYDEGSRAMYEVLRNAYLQRARDFPERIVIIDGSQAPEDVLEAAWTHIKQRLKI